MFTSYWIGWLLPGAARPMKNTQGVPAGADFNLERFALGVYNEICLALGGLIEEADSE